MNARPLLLWLLLAALVLAGGAPAAAAGGPALPAGAPALPAGGAGDPDAGTDAVHRLQISRQRPPCSLPPGMPIVPNDPGSLATTSGARCYGTRAPELELWLPLARYVWLERAAPNPAAWIDLGSVVLDARMLDEQPLGLRLSAQQGHWALETRYGAAATLTPLIPGTWQPLDTPDGQRLWVRFAGEAGSRPLGAGRIRYRAD